MAESVARYCCGNEGDPNRGPRFRNILSAMGLSRNARSLERHYLSCRKRRLSITEFERHYKPKGYLYRDSWIRVIFTRWNCSSVKRPFLPKPIEHVPRVGSRGEMCALKTINVPVLEYPVVPTYPYYTIQCTDTTLGLHAAITRGRGRTAQPNRLAVGQVAIFSIFHSDSRHHELI